MASSRTKRTPRPVRDIYAAASFNLFSLIPRDDVDNSELLELSKPYEIFTPLPPGLATEDTVLTRKTRDKVPDYQPKAKPSRPLPANAITIGNRDQIIRPPANERNDPVFAHRFARRERSQFPNSGNPPGFKPGPPTDGPPKRFEKADHQKLMPKRRRRVHDTVYSVRRYQEATEADRNNVAFLRNLVLNLEADLGDCNDRTRDMRSQIEALERLKDSAMTANEREYYWQNVAETSDGKVRQCLELIDDIEHEKEAIRQAWNEDFYKLSEVNQRLQLQLDAALHRQNQLEKADELTARFANIQSALADIPADELDDKLEKLKQAMLEVQDMRLDLAHSKTHGLQQNLTKALGQVKKDKAALLSRQANFREVNLKKLRAENTQLNDRWQSVVCVNIGECNNRMLGFLEGIQQGRNMKNQEAMTKTYQEGHRIGHAEGYEAGQRTLETAENVEVIRLQSFAHAMAYMTRLHDNPTSSSSTDPEVELGYNWGRLVGSQDPNELAKPGHPMSGIIGNHHHPMTYLHPLQRLKGPSRYWYHASKQGFDKATIWRKAGDTAKLYQPVPRYPYNWKSDSLRPFVPNAKFASKKLGYQDPTAEFLRRFSRSKLEEEEGKEAKLPDIGRDIHRPSAPIPYNQFILDSLFGWETKKEEEDIGW